MRKVFVCLVLLFTVTLDVYSQKLQVLVKLQDTTNFNPQDYLFTVQIKNRKFAKYKIQDTSYIKNRFNEPTYNFVWPYLEKKGNKGYSAVGEARPEPGLTLPLDTCEMKCCNCITLRKRESLNFSLKILHGLKLEKGEYRVYVHTLSPIMCEDCEGVREFASNYVYFKVN